MFGPFTSRQDPALVLTKPESELEGRGAMSEPAPDGPHSGCTVTVHQHTEIRITEAERFNLKMNGTEIPQSLILPTLQVYSFVTVTPVHLIDRILMGHRKQKQMTNISQ